MNYAKARRTSKNIARFLKIFVFGHIALALLTTAAVQYGVIPGKVERAAPPQIIATRYMKYRTCGLYDSPTKPRKKVSFAAKVERMHITKDDGGKWLQVHENHRNVWLLRSCLQ